MKGILQTLVASMLIALAPLQASEPVQQATKAVQSHASNLTNTIKTNTAYLVDTAKNSLTYVRENNYLAVLGQNLVDTAASTWQLAEHNPEATAALALAGSLIMYIGYLDYQAYKKQQEKENELEQARYEQTCKDDPYSAITFTV